MTRVRVLVAGLPRLLREVVEGVVRTQPDLDLVEVAVAADAGPAALRAAVAASAAEVAIVGLASEAAVATYDDVLFAHPRLRLLALTGDGRAATLYELRPHKTALGDASADLLLGAIGGGGCGGNGHGAGRSTPRPA